MKALRSILVLTLCISCLEPYIPPNGIESLTALVVDGHIATDGTATVKLARSIPLIASGFTPAEKGATVTIRSQSGDITLVETDSALYTASNLTVKPGDKYSLHIKTTDGSEYNSDEVEVYPTPPIDRIFYTFSAGDEALEVRIDAKDPNPNATGYYLWEADETYKYHAPVFAGYKIVNGKPVERQPSEVTYNCWRDVIAPPVILNTNYLTENDISAQRVIIIGNSSPKLSMEYSAMIKQRAISEDEYIFRVQLQKSTEQQGSLFSVIPGTVVGNLHAGDPGEYVLGYFRAQDVTQRRVFIDRSELPMGFYKQVRSLDCQTEKTCESMEGVGRTAQVQCFFVYQLGPNALITSANTNGAGVVLSYNFVVAPCGDCRYYGGTTVKPAFWKW